MFLLSKSPFDHVARATIKGAKAAIDEGYTLVGECDEKTYEVTKPLTELPKPEKKQAPKKTASKKR
jgi:hypothetical protein